MIDAFAGFVVGEVLDERGAEGLVGFAGSLEVFGARELFRLGRDLRRKHFHVVAFHSFSDGVRMLVHAFD